MQGRHLLHGNSGGRVRGWVVLALMPRARQPSRTYRESKAKLELNVVLSRFHAGVLGHSAFV
jgi:hypothetical protein